MYASRLMLLSIGMECKEPVVKRTLHQQLCTGLLDAFTIKGMFIFPFKYIFPLNVVAKMSGTGVISLSKYSSYTVWFLSFLSFLSFLWFLF